MRRHPARLRLVVALGAAGPLALLGCAAEPPAAPSPEAAARADARSGPLATALSGRRAAAPPLGPTPADPGAGVGGGAADGAGADGSGADPAAGATAAATGPAAAPAGGPGGSPTVEPAPVAPKAVPGAVPPDLGVLLPPRPDGKGIGRPELLPPPAEDGDRDATDRPFDLGAPAYAADTVVEALLAEPRLSLSPRARQDLADGRIHPHLTRLLLAATRRWTVTVTTFASGHALCVDGTNVPPCEGSSVSMHVYGRAVDIVAVDDDPVSAESTRAWDLLSFLVSLPADQRPNEIGVPWRALDPLPGIFSDADHDGHLHVAYEADGPEPALLPATLPPACTVTGSAGAASVPGLLLTADGQTPGLAGFTAAGDVCGTLTGSTAVDVALTPDCQGSWILDGLGRLHAFGTAPLLGDAAGTPGVALLPGPDGYRIVTRDGYVLGFGGRPPLGDARDLPEEVALGDRTVVAAADVPDGSGYWLLTDDGGVLSFGAAAYAGSLAEVEHHAVPVGIAATPSGRGYWVLTADGGVFAFGDAPYLGGATVEPDAPAVAIRAHGGGYAVITADGRLQGLGSGAEGALDARPMAPVVSAALC
jgi:hypothetical protein